MLARYVHGVSGFDDPLLAFAGNASLRADAQHLYTDGLGSVILLARRNGTVTGRNAYDEYGMPDQDNVGRFQYTGQAWVPEIGLYYYKARMYSPTLGRFMQTDPIGYADGMNMYAYVGNDPVNGVDPWGLWCASWTITHEGGPTGGNTTHGVTCFGDGFGGGGGGGYVPAFGGLRKDGQQGVQSDPTSEGQQSEGTPYVSCTGDVWTLGLDFDLVWFAGASVDFGVAYDPASGFHRYSSSSDWAVGFDVGASVEVGQWRSLDALNGQYRQLEGGVGPFSVARTYDSQGRHVGSTGGIGAGLPASFSVSQGSGGSTPNAASGQATCIAR